MRRREFLASSAAGSAVLSLGGIGVSPSARAATALPTWVTNLPLWQWYPIPNTALSSVAPSVRALGNTGPSSKIDTWCGATLKRSGSVYMLGAAGGHQDYAGNEVDALTLNTETPRWVQLRAPTPNSQIIDYPAQFYLDLRPSSAHTYYATQFINSLDRMVVVATPGVYSQSGVYPVCPSGWGYQYQDGNVRSFSFSMAGGDWDSPDYFTKFPGTGDTIACLCFKHPVTEDIYYSRNYSTGWWKWSAATKAWTKLSNASRNPWYAASACDPVRNRVLIAGGYEAASWAPEVRDLNGTLLSVSFGGLGAAALSTSGYPGLIYDEVNDNFLFFKNSGSSIQVLRVNPQSWFVDQPGFTGTTPAARTNGIHNSVQYVPELGGFVIANKYDANVLFVRTTLSPGAPPTPDTTPPPAPSSLQVA